MGRALSQILVVGSAIVLTGVVLNAAGQGMFGATAQQGAQYVTEGYGV